MGLENSSEQQVQQAKPESGFKARHEAMKMEIAQKQLERQQTRTERQEKIKQGWNNLTSGIKAFGGRLVAADANMGAKMREVVWAAGPTAENVVKTGQEKAVEGFNAAQTAVIATEQAVRGAVVEGAKAVGGAVVEGATVAGKAALEVGKRTGEATIGLAVLTGMGALWMGEKAIQGGEWAVKTGIKKVGEGVDYIDHKVDQASEAVDKFVDKVDNKANEIKSGAIELKNKAVEGFWNKWNKTKDAVTNKAKEIYTKVDNKLDQINTGIETRVRRGMQAVEKFHEEIRNDILEMAAGAHEMVGKGAGGVNEFLSGLAERSRAVSDKQTEMAEKRRNAKITHAEMEAAMRTSE